MPKKPQDDDGFSTSAEIQNIAGDTGGSFNIGSQRAPNEQERAFSYLQSLNALGRLREHERLISKREYEKLLAELHRKYADVLPD